MLSCEEIVGVLAKWHCAKVRVFAEPETFFPNSYPPYRLVTLVNARDLDTNVFANGKGSFDGMEGACREFVKEYVGDRAELRLNRIVSPRPLIRAWSEEELVLKLETLGLV